jgi:transposase
MLETISKSFGPDRVEIRTGVGQRRRWSDAEKERIIVEALSPGAVVSEVARRHDMFPQHLFAWLRTAKQRGLSFPVGDDQPDFVPVVADERARAGHSREAGIAVEIAIGGVEVRVHNGAEATTIEAVLRAIRHSGMNAC